MQVMTILDSIFILNDQGEKVRQLVFGKEKGIVSTKILLLTKNSEIQSMRYLKIRFWLSPCKCWLMMQYAIVAIFSPFKCCEFMTTVGLQYLFIYFYSNNYSIFRMFYNFKYFEYKVCRNMKYRTVYIFLSWQH